MPASLFVAGLVPAGPLAPPTRLHDLAQRAITASAVLTAACMVRRAASDAQFTRFDQEAWQARQDLLACLEQEHGIDAAMADQLGALL